MAAQSDRATVTWSTPECPFSIECSSRVLDDIRLSVTDAFFSLPRGGAEIGGILLGAWQEDRLVISDYAALDCEHALGPSFTLSVSDETRLQDLIRATSGSGAARPVGWYHSHTRSGVLLSDSDLTIHNRYFPEPWQVALVVKPHTFEPMRAGFFFRGPGGIIHSSASYHEFPIEPQPLRQVPRAVPREAPAQPNYGSGPAGPIVDVRAERAAAPAPAAPIVDVRAERVTPPVTAAPIVSPEAEAAARVAPAAPAIGRRDAEPATPPAAPAATSPAAMPEPARETEPRTAAPVPLPRMFEVQPERSWAWLKVLLVVAVGAAAGAALYAERDAWYPPVASLLQPASPEVNAASTGLNTVDEAGQLQIRWGANSTPVRRATGASLEIVDGGPPPSSITLDVQHLASGVFTYGRRTARVDVTLVLDQPDGTKVRQVTSFLGQKPPAPAALASSAQANQDREEMLQLVAGLRAQLDAELEHNRKLEKLLATVRAQLREQQLRRLGNQARPPGQ
jgi:proteasome lid subunit RPN8/RPN11